MKAFTNNAADASPEAIEVSGHCSHSELQLVIRDFGPGLSQEILQMAGTPFFTTKVGRGMGLGLYLSRIKLERFRRQGQPEQSLSGWIVDNRSAAIEWDCSHAITLVLGAVCAILGTAVGKISSCTSGTRQPAMR